MKNFNNPHGKVLLEIYAGLKRIDRRDQKAVIKYIKDKKQEYNLEDITLEELKGILLLLLIGDTLTRLGICYLKRTRRKLGLPNK